ncbi:MAG: stage III sporulation protein AD [Firmicutes bacterium]|nr:stage III sporulation protein AD [Bacillota bacterium]
MEILRIVGICLIGTILTVIVRSKKPEIAMQLSIVIGLIIFSMMLPRIGELISILSALVSRAGVDNIYFVTVLKVIGVAYIVGFGAEVSRDAGENAIASKIEFAGKVLIMVMALPIMIAILETITRLIP